MTKRREKGTGSIYADASRPGRFVGEVTIDGKRRRVSAKTKTDARARLRELVARSERGELVENRRTTVAEVVDLFMERELPTRRSAGRDLAPRTVQMYAWAAQIIRAELGSTPVAKLKVQDVERMYDSLATRAERPLGSASLRQLASKFTLMMTFGERRELVARNVVRLARTTPSARQPIPRVALNAAHARQLLAALRDPFTGSDGRERRERNGAMFALSLMLGLRPGEAAGLWWSDLRLDGDEPVVNVTRARRDDRTGVVVIADDLKTRSAKRTLGLPAELVSLLVEHQQAQAKERLAATSWADDRLVFATTTGNPIEASNSRRQLRVVCARAGVPPVRPNELRHSCTSLLADQGMSHASIADLLGHTTPRMVDSVYRHRLRDVIDIATRASWINPPGGDDTL